MGVVMEKKFCLVGATPILIDGERYEPGDVVGLTDKEAAGLKGYVSPAPVEAAPAALASAKSADRAGDEPATPKKGAKA